MNTSPPGATIVCMRERARVLPGVLSCEPAAAAAVRRHWQLPRCAPPRARARARACVRA